MPIIVIALGLYVGWLLWQPTPEELAEAEQQRKLDQLYNRKPPTTPRGQA